MITRKKQLLLLGLILLLIINIFATTSFGRNNNLISLDFKDTDIRDIFRALASQAGVNIYLEHEVTGNVTISLSNVTFTEALKIITEKNNLTYTFTDNVYYIKPIDDSFLNVEFAEGLLQVEARKIGLNTLFETISQKSGVSIVPAPELQQERISIFIKQTNLTDAIETILTQANCISEQIGTVMFIRKKASQQFSFTVNYQNNLLTIDAHNIPITALCRTITEKTGVSIVSDQNVNQNVTIFLQNLSLPDSLSVLCETNNLLLFKEGDAWRISKKTGAYRIKVKDNLLSIDVEGIDVNTVMKEIARQSGLNIILDREVRGMVSAHFQDLPLFEGLMVLLENHGWVIDKQTNHYYVRPNSNQVKNIRIQYDPSTSLFDLDIQSAPLTVVLNEMARRAGINIVILAQVNWTVNNVRLQKISFTQAMDFLFKGTIFTYKLVDNTYLIGDGMLVKPENRDFSEVKIYTLKYVKADQFLNTLPPVFPRQSFMPLPEKNALIVSGPPTIHNLFAEYLEQIDVATIEDRTEVIKIKYLKADDVMKLIPSSIPKNDLVVVKEANAIVVTGPQNLISQVKSFIEKIDQINPMIVFDILVVQITDSDSITWEAPTGTLNKDGKELILDAAAGLINFSEGVPAKSTKVATLTALINNGRAKVLANPTITTLNGYPANFNVSTKWSFTVPTETKTVDKETETVNQTVKTYDSGLYITITPWVSANNQITMEIKPKISEFGEAPKGSNLPSTSERSTETTIRVNDGQTIIISGLRNNRQQKTVSKIPILGHIPLLGHLFKNTTVRETQDEFIIVITPKLVFEQPATLAEDPTLEKYSPVIHKELVPETDKKRKKR